MQDEQQHNQIPHQNHKPNNFQQPYNPNNGQKPSNIKTVEKITVWTMAISAIAFALISILAIWGLFDDGTDIVWKSLTSLGVIAFAALVINVAAGMLDSKKK